MATDTKQKPPASPNTLTKSAVDKKFTEITANLDPEKKTKQDEDREYVIHKLSQTAGERVRKLALSIKAGSKLREEVEKLAHELEESVPVLAKRARSEDALVTEIEALVDKTEKSITSMAKEEAEKERKKHEKEEEKDHKLHAHKPQKPAKADKTVEEKAKEKLDAIRAEIHGEKPMEANATVASFPELTPERDKQLHDEQKAYLAGTAPPHITPEGVARAEEILAEARTSASGTNDRVDEIRRDTEKRLAESGLNGPHITPEGVARAEKIHSENSAASPDERKAFAQGSIQPHARVSEIRRGTQELMKKHGVNAASINADVIRAAKMEEIRQRRVKAKQINPGGKPIVGSTSKPPRLSVSSSPLAGKVRMQLPARRFIPSSGAYYAEPYSSNDPDSEYSGEPSESGKVAHGPSDNNEGSTNMPGKMRMAREGLKAARSGFGGGGAAGRGGGLGNILRGGLGGGAKAGGRVATQVAARASVALMANPWFWVAVVVVLILLFIIWIIAGDTSERAKQAQNCAAPVETMKVTVTGPAEAAANQPLSYQIAVTDTVPNQEVLIVATIPQGVSAVPADITSSWTRFTLNGNTITWKATENLPPNSLSPPNFNFTVTLRATAPSTNSVIVIDATPTRSSTAGGQTTIVLDPGHGGSESVVTDPTTGLIDRESANTPEREEVFEVAQKVRADLEAAGYRVVMTKDSVLQTTSHRTRSDVANNANAALAVSIHNDHGQPYSWAEIYTQKVGLYREANGNRVEFTDAALAQKSLEYANIMAQERATAEGRPVPLRDANFDSRPGYSSGNIPLVMLFSRVPWVYHEIGAAPVGQRVPQEQIDNYAIGIAAGVKRAVPVAAAPAPGGAGCAPGGAPGSGAPNSLWVAPAPADSCGGKYASYIARNTFLPMNYGDPECNFTEDELRNLLMELENRNEEFVNFWYVTIIPHESGFNPNAWARPIGSQLALDPQGAWGLYQKGSSKPPGSPPPAGGLNGPLDRGDVNWEEQTRNAVQANKDAGCDFWYYGTYRRAVGQRIDRC